MVELNDKRAQEGDSVKFECQFSGTPMPGTKAPIPLLKYIRNGESNTYLKENLHRFII